MFLCLIIFSPKFIPQRRLPVPLLHQILTPTATSCCLRLALPLCSPLCPSVPTVWPPRVQDGSDDDQIALTLHLYSNQTNHWGWNSWSCTKIKLRFSVLKRLSVKQVQVPRSWQILRLNIIELCYYITKWKTDPLTRLFKGHVLYMVTQLPCRRYTYFIVVRTLVLWWKGWGSTPDLVKPFIVNITPRLPMNIHYETVAVSPPKLSKACGRVGW